jgi:hypothetical protein
MTGSGLATRRYDGWEGNVKIEDAIIAKELNQLIRDCSVAIEFLTDMKASGLSAVSYDVIGKISDARMDITDARNEFEENVKKEEVK